jgi:hypothetical protein
MIAPMRSLARHRAALVQRSQLQRTHLGQVLEPFTRRLTTADRALATVRSHPLAVGIAGGVIGLLGPRRLLYWAARVLPFVSMLRRL